MTEFAEWAAAHASTVGRRIRMTGWPPPEAISGGGQRPEYKFRSTRIFEGHEARVWAVAVGTTREGSRLLATGSADQTARIWNLDTGAPIAQMSGHTGVVRSAAWTPDYRDGQLMLATASADGMVKVWDTSGRCVHDIAGHQDGVCVVTWAPRAEGLKLATTAFDRTARIWSLAGYSEQTLDHSTYPQAADWLLGPDGLCLAVGDNAGGVQIWHPGTQSIMRTFKGGSGGVNSIAAEPTAFGDNRVASASNDGTVRIWDASDGSCTRVLEGHNGPVWGLAWTKEPGGRSLLATGGDDRMARVWDPDTGTCLAILEHPAAVNGVAFADADGTMRLVTACDDARARLWTAVSSSVSVSFRPKHVLLGHARAVVRTALAEAADGRLMLATASEDHTVRIWDADAGTLEHVAAGHTGEVADVVWSRDNTGRLQLASAGLDDVLMIWNPLTGSRISTRMIGPQWSVARIRHPDGRDLLAAGGPGNQTQVWDLSTEQSVATFADPKIPTNTHVIAVAWTSDENRLLLAVGDSTGSTRVWDFDSGECLLRLRGEAYVTSVGWTRAANGQLVLVAGAVDGTTRLWNVPDGHLIHTLDGHSGDVNWVSCAHLPEGRAVVATASSDKTVRVWDIESGRPIAVIDHPGGVCGVDLWVGQDGRIVMAAACNDGRSYLWEMGRILASPSKPAKAGEVNFAARRLPVALNEAVTLGSSGLWLPLGLVSDIVALTGSSKFALFDLSLNTLSSHPGVRGLQQLGWPVPARAAFAALLCASQPAYPQFRPPPDSSPAECHGALQEVLTAPITEPVPAEVDIEALRSAADQVTAKTLTLLQVIGPGAAADDPLLALRLAHRCPELPELTTPQNSWLAAPDPEQRRRTYPVPGLTVRAAGTAGVTRRGSAMSLLLTQLALPDDVFYARYAAGELLHRHYPSGTRLWMGPVTIILDTTPPTFGPAEGLLRLMAHLVTKVLWERGARPLLVTLSEPDRVYELATPVDMLRPWTSRTLNPPDLATALRTAATTRNNPTLTLTTHHLAVQHPTPSVQRRLVTTHQPDWAPQYPSTGPYHHHLAPDSTDVELAAVLTAVLAPAHR